MSIVINENMPLISIIMPAYNVEKYIGRAIESVLNQTYSNIELIICNDASTDNTKEIIENTNDDRVVLVDRSENSGSACLPRYIAFENCSGDIIVLLDADDYLEDNYIEKMYGRLYKCHADICLGKMVFINTDGKLLGDDQSIPHKGFDYSLEMTGSEAFFYTVPQWKISINGCMAKKEIWQSAFNRTSKPGQRGIHDDENVSRYLLLYASKVTFNESLYYYTINPKSVTHVFTKKVFDSMLAEEDLLNLIREDYGKESEEYKATEQNDFNVFVYDFKSFFKSIKLIPDNDIMYYLKRYKLWHDRMHWKVIREQKNKADFYIYRFYGIGIVVNLIISGKIHGGIIITKQLAKALCQHVRNNRYYKWYIYRRKRERMLTSIITNKYKRRSGQEREYPNCTINIIDGTIQGGGLADRLRGIISTYAICKEKEIDYRLYFTCPFSLEQYLVPGEYNWKISEEDICRNSNVCKIIVLDTTEDSFYQNRKQRKYLNKKIKPNLQNHVFTNAGFAYELEYGELFRELFKPSIRLQQAIDRQKKMLGERYISVSTRFLDLLGDFNETYGYGMPLDEEESSLLIKNVINEIEKLHVTYPESMILVNSDSAKFLKATEKYEYTYRIQGNITHIDQPQMDSEYERYEKTFLDFMMISSADEIFLLKERRMRNSGYPYAASRLYGKKYHIIEF